MKIEDDGSAAEKIVDYLAETEAAVKHARLPRAPRRRAAEGRARRARLRHALGGDVAGVVVGTGVRTWRPGAGAFGATTVYVVDDPVLASPLPQPRVDALEALVERDGRRERPLRLVGARCRRRRRPRRSARRGAQLGPHRRLARGRRARGEAARARRHGRRRGGVDEHAADRARPVRHVRPGRDRRHARRCRRRRRRSRTSPPRRGWSSGTRGGERARRSRTRT